MFSGLSIAQASELESRSAVFDWLVGLRWLAVAGVAIVLLAAGPVLGRLPEGSAPWLWAVTAALLGYNAALATPRPRLRWFGSLPSQIVIDCAALATLVHFSGGIENPFLPLFVLHAVNANVVLSSRAALALVGVIVVLLASVVVGEGAGILPHHCLQHGRAVCQAVTLRLDAFATLGGLTLTLITSALLARFLAARLRLGQHKLAAIVDELNREKDRLSSARGGVETERTRLQAIIDCMADAVTFWAPSGAELFSNERAQAIWRARGDATGIEPFAALLGEGGDSATSRAQTTFDSGGRTYEATHSLVRSPAGQTLGVVTVARDITERLAMERHLMHDEQMSVVGKLAASIAHEINNPIGVVVLYSQHALALLPPDSVVYKHLETIRRNADGCKKIIGDLLKLARPRKPERQRVDLRGLCREVVDSVQPLAANAGVTITSGGQTRSGVPIWADVDAGMLHQAVLNLAVNAIEAAGRGGAVWIGAYETQDAAATARVIEVRDTGLGVPEDQREQIFQPFFTTKDGGTGLGLAVANNVVQSHHGRIDVEAGAGTGTVFRILLPDRATIAPPAALCERSGSPAAESSE